MFDDDSEDFFLIFWFCNAMLLIMGIFILSMKFNYMLMPFILFSPVTLLTIERGNIDAAVFFFTFIPVVFFKSDKLRGLFLCFASALKIFPLFAYISFFKTKSRFFTRDIILGSVIFLPILIYSIGEIPMMIEGSSKSFSFSFGLSSILYLSIFAEKKSYALLLMVIFIFCAAVILRLLNKHQSLLSNFSVFSERLDKNSIILLSMSLCIFIGTFLTFTNWAYRLIFLIPAFLIVSGRRTWLEQIIFWNIFAIYWIPVLPRGGAMLNLLCYLLFIPTFFLLIRVLKDKTKESADK